MLYKEIFTGFSEVHKKHKNTLCEQNIEIVIVNLAVHIVTTGL